MGPLFALFSLGRPTFDASRPSASLLTAEVALRELCEILGIETDGIRERTQLLGELHAVQQQVRGLEAQIAFAANANGTQARGRATAMRNIYYTIHLPLLTQMINNYE